MRKLGKKGLSKGPAMRSAANSFKSLALTISGLCRAETRFVAKNDRRAPAKWRGKQNLKPVYIRMTSSAYYMHKTREGVFQFVLVLAERDLAAAGLNLNLSVRDENCIGGRGELHHAHR